MPGVRGETLGSAARVLQKVGDERVERAGRVVRLLPDLDSGGAMARILVEIEDPLGLKQPGQLPLLLNSYVSVEIEARPIDRALEVPRAALRDGDRVLVVDGESKLRVRDVEVVWRRADTVLVGAGLTDGEEVVVSQVAAPVDGMTVRRSERPAEKAGSKAPSAAVSAPPVAASSAASNTAGRAAP